MKRLTLAMVVIFYCFAFIEQSGLAQENTELTCIPPNFLVGSAVRVVGSVEAGGLHVRNRTGLDSPVVAFIPLETYLNSLSYVDCEDGRNWYRVIDVMVNGENVSGFIVGDDGFHYWLEATYFCPVTIAALSFPGYRRITNVYPGEDFITIGVLDDERLHPVLQDHYLIDKRTGIMTPTTYPFADIVTRELTDKLGITDFVFGDKSNDGFSLHVSPDKKKILYFLPGTTVENCAHFCYWVEGFVADADGSNPISLGEIPTEASLARIYWGTDGRLYFTHIPESGPAFFTVGFCITDDCTLEGGIDDIAAEYGVTVPSGSVVTTSPNGQYLAINPLYREFESEDLTGAYIIDLKNDKVIALPDNGLSGIPIFWDRDRDNQILYGIDSDNVQDDNAYSRELENDEWARLNLNFEQLSYEYLGNTIPLREDLFYDNWQIDWQYLGLEMYLARDGLRCIRGGRG